MSLRVHRKFFAIAATSVIIVLLLRIQLGTLDPSRTIELLSDHSGEPSKSLPCSRLPGANDTLVIMKTGATEMQDKLPVHLNTILRCSPNYIIYSDMAETFEGNVVLDALEDVDPNIKASHDDFALYRRLQQQNGRSGLGLTELSGQVSRPMGASGKPTNPGWKVDKWKFLPMVRRTLQDHPDKAWYLFIETDTFLLWESLLAYIAELDQTKPYYIGGQTWIGDVEFAHGGSGYLVSRPALEMVVKQYVDNKHEWETFTDGHWAGDCVLGKAFKDTGIPLTRAWPIFQGDDIGNMNYGRSDDSHRLWCHPTVSYHHLSPLAIDDFWEFEQNQISNTAKVSPVRPYTSRRHPNANADPKRRRNPSYATKTYSPNTSSPAHRIREPTGTTTATKTEAPSRRLTHVARSAKTTRPACNGPLTRKSTESARRLRGPIWESTRQGRLRDGLRSVFGRSMMGKRQRNRVKMRGGSCRLSGVFLTTSGSM